MVRTVGELCVCCTFILVACSLIPLVETVPCHPHECSPTPSNCFIVGIGSVFPVVDKRPGHQCCRVCPKDFMEKCGVHDHCHSDANDGSRRYFCVQWGTHKRVETTEATGYCLRRSCFKNCDPKKAKRCASNGQYYNQCFLGRRNCYSNTTETFGGKCDNKCKAVTCADDKKCVEGRCVCKSETECEHDNHPICASNHRSYSSVCEMRIKSCRNNLRLKVISEGRCESNGSGEASF